MRMLLPIAIVALGAIGAAAPVEAPPAAANTPLPPAGPCECVRPAGAWTPHAFPGAAAAHGRPIERAMLRRPVPAPAAPVPPPPRPAAPFHADTPTPPPPPAPPAPPSGHWQSDWPDGRRHDDAAPGAPAPRQGQGHGPFAAPGAPAGQWRDHGPGRPTPPPRHRQRTPMGAPHAPAPPCAPSPPHAPLPPLPAPAGQGHWSLTPDFAPPAPPGAVDTAPFEGGFWNEQGPDSEAPTAFAAPIGFFDEQADDPPSPAPADTAPPFTRFMGQRGRDDSRGDSLIRFLEQRRPALADRLRQLRERSPDAFDDVIGEALAVRIEEALNRVAPDMAQPPSPPTPPQRRAPAGAAPRQRGDQGGFWSSTPAAPVPGVPPTAAPAPPPPPGAYSPAPLPGRPAPPRPGQGRWSVLDDLMRGGPPPLRAMSDEERERIAHDAAALDTRDRELETRSAELADEIRAMRSQGDSAGAEERQHALREAVQESFDTRGRLRELHLRRVAAELRAMQERFEDLRREFDQRSQKRSEIIEARLDELVGGL